MKQFNLAEIVTRDKLVHQGLFFKPLKKNKKAILWVHGLTDNFYGDHKLLEALADECEKQDWGLAAFNNRGHDIVTSISQTDKGSPKGRTSITQGAAYEKFSTCIWDIDAGITFLANQGFSEIVIAGISTGANKVCYWAGTQKDPRVVGIVLVSSISDVAIKRKELGSRYEAVIEKVRQMIKKGKGESLTNGLDYMPITPNRFLSLYEENSAEDVFPYYQRNPKFAILAKIRKPLMVIMGGADEYTERPITEIIETLKKFQRSSNFKPVIVPGAFHSYGGKETEFAHKVVQWIKTIG